MNDSRTGNSIKNIVFSFGNQALALILGFISRTVFLRCLSVDYLGISGLFSDILQMLSLADLGFGTAMTYSMYKPLAEKDYTKLAGLTELYKRIYRIIAAVITCVGLALVPFLQYIVNLDSGLPYLKLYYVLYLINTIASYLVVYKTAILNADQKGYILTKYAGVFNILKTVCMITFLILTKNYTVYLCVQIAFTYGQNIYSSHIAEKMYPFVKEKVKLPWNEAKEVFKNIKSVFIYKISGVLLNATDNTLISIIIGTAAVGYYSNYTMITTKIAGFVNTLFYSLTASLGNLIVKENQEKRFEIFKVMQSVSILLSTICVICVVFLEQDLIKIWLGTEYVLDNIVLYAIVINFYLSIALLPIWVFREATGLYRKTKYIMLLTAGLNLFFSIILGEMIGLAGIIFASALSRLVTYFWIEPQLLFEKYFGQSCVVYFIGIVKSLLVTVLVYLVEWLTVSRIHVSTWIGLGLKSCLVGGICLGIVMLFYWKSEGAVILKNKIKVIMQGFRK